MPLIDSNGDRLYFDEECFLRGEAGMGRFKVNSLAPVSGKGLIVGSAVAETTIKNVEINDKVLAKRVTFL